MRKGTSLSLAIEELKNKGIPPIEQPPHVQPFYVLFVPEKPKQLPLPQGVKVLEAKDVIQALP